MTFRDLHYADLPLILPNAWDVPSALALRDAGLPALGTTSFGVAACQGVPDGTRSTRDANLRLARALRPLGCYLSVDIEDLGTNGSTRNTPPPAGSKVHPLSYFGGPSLGGCLLLGRSRRFRTRTKLGLRRLDGCPLMRSARCRVPPGLRLGRFLCARW